MPKENIDYSNTIIYKIYCNDKTINDVYVGHTTNFTKRKHQHKLCCTNLNNKLKIYKTIREHCGWDNWNMIEIAKYNCKDKTEARIKEQYHYDDLNSSLNSCSPYTDKNKFFCSTCNINCTTKNVYETHINCSLHNKNAQLNNDDTTKNEQNEPTDYYCEICEYNCCKKYNYKRHILTAKHIKTTKDIQNEELGQNEKYKCINCNKIYKDRVGLWRHKKKCIETIVFDSSYNEIKLLTNLVLEVVKQNQELISQNNDFQKQNQELQKMLLK
jgi:hypothetical protein